MCHFLPHFWEFTQAWPSDICDARRKRENLAPSTNHNRMFHHKLKSVLEHPFWLLLEPHTRPRTHRQDVSSNRPKNILQNKCIDWPNGKLGFIYTKNNCCSFSLFTHCVTTCNALYFFLPRKTFLNNNIKKINLKSICKCYGINYFFNYENSPIDIVKGHRFQPIFNVGLNCVERYCKLCWEVSQIILRGIACIGTDTTHSPAANYWPPPQIVNSSLMFTGMFIFHVIRKHTIDFLTRI